VRWWERDAPEESDPQLWTAVQRIQARRQQLRMTVTDLARRLSGRGRPIRRETLSRVLNGKQPTTWETAEHMADILGIDLVIKLDDAGQSESMDS
jgi:transcriptional regulator with XRE-family HTH domain